ncbi:MAG: hypothetical protein WD055_01245 [Candidatus Dependentiae bacterium]
MFKILYGYLMLFCVLVCGFYAYGADNLEVVIVGTDGKQERSDFTEIELGDMPDVSVCIDDMGIYVPHNPYISQKKRSKIMAQVLDDFKTKKPETYQNLHCVIRTRKDNVLRGFEVQVNKEQLESVVGYFVKKVLKKDIEVLGREIQREKIRKVVTGLVSAGAAAGLSALIAYLGSLW